MNALIAEAVNWKEEIFKWTCLAIGGAVILFFLYAIVIVVINIILDWRMPRTTVYDKAKYYFECCGDEQSAAYIPIGMLLGWLIANDLLAEEFLEDEYVEEHWRKFKNRQVTGPQLYCKMLDGVLTDEVLGDEGNRFTKSYIDQYYGDFAKTFCGGGDFDERCFRVEDTWENYDRICKVIDGRYDFWKQSIASPR